jgi:DNA-binding LacI/PurR family transcriptional regulator
VLLVTRTTLDSVYQLLYTSLKFDRFIGCLRKIFLVSRVPKTDRRRFMSVTIYDIAKQVSLSHTTVSRVLNAKNSINIPEVTRNRVLAAAQELGYRPNLSARTLATGKSKLIALQLYRMDSPYAMEVARQMQAIAWEDGYEVLVHEFIGDEANLRFVVDGVLQLDRLFRPEDIKPDTNAQTPHVALGALAIDTIDSVVVDLQIAATEAMQLLLRAGRKKIVLLGDHHAGMADGRMAAYKTEMMAADLPIQLIHTPANLYTRACGYQALRDSIEQKGVPEAVFCMNDTFAVGCYRALQERGLRIPDDVAVIGCDDTEEGSFLAPTLTTISQPIDMLCRSGWELLKRRMEDRTCDRQQRILPASLRLRDSH